MDRPNIILFVTSSLDGRISIRPNQTLVNSENDPNLKDILGTRDDWENFEQRIRNLHPAEMIMEGSNMLVSNNGQLRELDSFLQYSDEIKQFVLSRKDFLPKNVIASPQRTGWLGIIDGRGRVRGGYKGEERTPLIHLVSNDVPNEYLAFLMKSNIPYIIAGNRKVNLSLMMKKLKNILGIQTILTSSGGRLSGALIREGLLDEINILFNPVIIGGEQTPILFSAPEVQPPSILPSNLSLIKLEKLSNDQIWIRAKVKN